MVRFCLNSIGRKRYFGQTDILLVASEKYRQLPYKNILRVRGNDERFTRLLPPPEGSGFPPMANERILFMKKNWEILQNRIPLEEAVERIYEAVKPLAETECDLEAADGTIL